MHKLFIINKNAGAKNNKRLIKEIERVYLNRDDYSIVETKSEEEAKKIIKDFNFGVVYLIGGDGTIGAMSECFIDRDIAFGIIPSGTGNDFAKYFKKQFSIKETIEPEFRKIDAYRVNGRVGVNVFSMGFDTMVLKNSYRVRKIIPSKLSYYVGALMSINHLTPMDLIITLEDEKTKETIKGKFIICAVCNASYYGSGFYPGVNAKLDDGLLNLVQIKMPPIYHIFDLVPKYRNGRILESDYAHEYLCKKIIINSKDAIYANIDGKIFKDTQFEIEVLKDAINFAY